MIIIKHLQTAQLGWAVEYADYLSAVGWGGVLLLLPKSVRDIFHFNYRYHQYIM